MNIPAPRRRRRRRRGAAAARRDRRPARPATCVTTLGGVVESVEVAVGQMVNAGDTVLVLEAMKMKTPMVAPSAGTVAQHCRQARRSGRTWTDADDHRLTARRRMDGIHLLDLFQGVATLLAADPKIRSGALS